MAVHVQLYLPRVVKELLMKKKKIRVWFGGLGLFVHLRECQPGG